MGDLFQDIWISSELLFQNKYVLVRKRLHVSLAIGCEYVIEQLLNNSLIILSLNLG